MRSLADCAHTRVTAAQYGTIPFSPNGGYNGLFGGNPELEPEESDTRSIGFLYWPRFVDGLSTSLDWFEIETDDAIEVVEIATTLDRCLDTGDPVFCDRIRRNPGLGELDHPLGPDPECPLALHWQPGVRRLFPPGHRLEKLL